MSEPGQNFQPQEQLLHTLLSMGINPDLANEALFCTGNSSVDLAINYIYGNNVHSSDEARLGRALNIGVPGRPSHYKMVCVVNMSLQMGLGKIASQVAHACLGLYRELLNYQISQVLSQWEQNGEKTVVLRGADTNAVYDLYQKAKQEGLPAFLVRDMGRTQVAEGSITVISIFGAEENVDKVTGKLELL